MVIKIRTLQSRRMYDDLLWPEERVDRDEHAAGSGGSENGGDRLDPLVEKDRHAVVALEAKGYETGRHAAGRVPELVVASRSRPCT